MSIVGSLSLAHLAYEQFPFLAKKTDRAIGDLIPHVVIRETHKDQLQITDHPIQLGSPVTDHAFKLPAELTIECAWSDSPPAKNLLDAAKNIAGSLKSAASVLTGEASSQSKAMYGLLRGLQDNRVLLDVTTGKRVYTNMLIKSLTVTTESETENILMVTAELREVFIVQAKTASIPTSKESHATPSQTTPPVNAGTKALVPAKVTP